MYRIVAVLAAATLGVATVTLLAASNGGVQRAYEDASLADVLIIGAIGAIVALILEPVLGRSLRWFEGVDPPSGRISRRVRYHLIDRQRRKAAILQRRAEHFYELQQREGESRARYFETGDISGMDEFKKWRRSTREEWDWGESAALELFRDYPSTSRVRTTRLGNIVGATEDRIELRYNLAAGIAWPRLLAVLPTERRHQVAASRSRLDALARLTILAALWSCLGCATVLVGLVSTNHDLSFAGLILIPLAGFSALAFYRHAQDAARAWGEDVEVSFDLFRLKLLESLSIRFSGDLAGIDTISAKLTDWLAGGEIHGLPFFYQRSLSGRESRSMAHETHIYNFETAGAVGPRARAERFQIIRLGGADGEELDLGQLAQDLALLQDELRKQPDSDDRDESVGAITQAKRAAGEGDAPATMSALARLGKVAQWTVRIAEKVGVPVAIKAIQAATGLG